MRVYFCSLRIQEAPFSEIVRFDLWLGWVWSAYKLSVCTQRGYLLQPPQQPHIVLSHTSALWYHRLAAAGIFSPPFSCNYKTLESAKDCLSKVPHLDKSWFHISTTDLAARSIYIQNDVENFLLKHPHEDPWTALAASSLLPHNFQPLKNIELLCNSSAHRHWRNNVAVHRHSTALPKGLVLRAGVGLYVASPEFTIFQMARYLKDVHLLAALITEFSGSYVLLPQGLLCCSRYTAEGKVPIQNSRLIGDGYVECAPLISVDNLKYLLNKYPELPGSTLVEKALKASGNGSESPFETAVSVELQLIRSRGGAGAGSARLNEKIPFNEIEQQMANGRSHARADILFVRPDGKRIDVEPGGVFGHSGKKAMDLDRRRRHALEHAGVEVIDITWDEYANRDVWETICRRITNHLGKRFHVPSLSIQNKQQLVHDDFCNWNCMRIFPPDAWRR